jgi:hypothetical protein
MRTAHTVGHDHPLRHFLNGLVRRRLDVEIVERSMERKRFGRG